MAVYRFDRMDVVNISNEQWAGVQRLFNDKPVGSQVTLEEVTSRGHLSRGAALAILVQLHASEAIELCLAVYHGCRTRSVSTVKWGRGFPTYPWVCPICFKSLKGPSHTVVEELRYGIIARVKMAVDLG